MLTLSAGCAVEISVADANCGREIIGNAINHNGEVLSIRVVVISSETSWVGEPYILSVGD